MRRGGAVGGLRRPTEVWTPAACCWCYRRSTLVAGAARAGAWGVCPGGQPLTRMSCGRRCPRVSLSHPTALFPFFFCCFSLCLVSPVRSWCPSPRSTGASSATRAPSPASFASPARARPTRRSQPAPRGGRPSLTTPPTSAPARSSWTAASCTTRTRGCCCCGRRSAGAPPGLATPLGHTTVA